MKKIIVVIVPLMIITGAFLSCSRDAPAPTGPAPKVIVPVVMNEIYTQGIRSNPDWIEIYNPNSDSISIGGYTVYSLAGKNGAKPKKAIPSGTYVPGMGHYVVVVNDTISASAFDLSAGGEKVWFENGTGTIVDSVNVPALGVDSSYARKPDGASTWVIATPPTKGAANSILPIVMNEIFVQGVAGNLDWIELYNPNTASANIGGYKIYDIGGQGGTKPKKDIPVGTIIAAKGFFVIIVDTASFTGDLSGFGLSQNGEAVWLENANGNILDNVTFPAMTSTGGTVSYGRKPDGSSNWQILTVITRGTSNN
ncbi:MAG: lamin tail domain-containing protein [Ignavibacteriales bacterium]|nr:lamin tail domain-containing protein [Ignavibacteriales bacterium]